VPDAMQQADALLSPQPQQLVAGEVRKEDLQGTFSVHLRVNPDLPYDRSVLQQLAQFLLPYMAERYPIGARLLLRKLWNLLGQGGFDEIYPEAIALLETQRLMAKVLAETQQVQMQMQMMQAQAQQAQQQAQQPQGPAGPSPQTQQMLDSGMQAEAMGQHAQAQAQVHDAQHQQHRNTLQTHGEVVKVLQQLQKLQQQSQPPATNGREG
jgi:hypothetical protein